jgi:predicted chitinase
MPLQLTRADWQALFPRAPAAVIDAFASPKGMAALQKAGILETRTRLAYALANVEHECGGFTIPRLTENVNYTARRMAQVWPGRFPDGSSSVVAKFGSNLGWQLRAFDAIYGNRMGNRPGTSDGSKYIGRGGPQITGRDGYAQVGKRAGLDLVNLPELASLAEHQPAILAAFWSWKNLNRFADAGNWLGCVKSWNGGTNGLADRNAKMSGNNPIIARLAAVNKLKPFIDDVTVTKSAKPSTEIGTQSGTGSIGGTGAVVAAQTGRWGLAIAILAATVLAMGVTYVVLRRRDTKAPAVRLPTFATVEPRDIDGDGHPLHEEPPHVD